MNDTNGHTGPTLSQQRGLRPWKPGESGNPKGRPEGSRNKLGEAFLDDMFEAWKAQGIDAINRVIKDRPQDFLKVVASLLPQKYQADVVHRFVALMPPEPETGDEWQRQYSPKTINGTTQ